MPKRSWLFYGWIVVAVAFVTVAVGYGIRYSFSVFFVSIIDEFGWSRADTSLIFSINLLLYGAFGPIAGSMVDRLGPRAVIGFGAFVLAVGTALCALANAIWQFYILWGILMSFGICVLGYVSHTPLISNWFIRRRGTAIGIFGVGLAISFSMPTLTQYLIDSVGWRASFLVLAALSGALVMPLVIAFQRHKPSDMGLEPDGVKSNQADISSAKASHQALVVNKEWAAREWTLPRALKTYQVWALFFAMMSVWGLTVNVILPHFVAYSVDQGYSKMFATYVYSLYGIVYGVGSFMGTLSDRIGRERAGFLASGLAAIGVLMLILNQGNSTPWALYAYAVFFGLGTGLHTPNIPAACADLFQGKHLGAIYGFCTFGLGIGGLFGPWVAGLVFDRLNTYVPAFWMSFVAVMLCSVFVWIARPSRVRVVAGMAPKSKKTASA
ncbi:MAG: MFS transporter [Dehalococcoidia bacterium]|nr:MFS transporter [Dehalococcoidia bacterium]